ncbi:hypothetical protein B0T10DRAFT_316078 [Thelonectria olida]|uniref:DUF7137 domain-containing protein n=1 Tax=Thelonectria olida TaxID=1576542 RepID=A0A9P8W646_9HYPO|nr:hypothetical protein B0T10DRAFT_316078 [Thelonectria olida]
MRPAGTFLQVAVCLSSLAPLTAAWPSWLPALDSLVVRHPEVIRRADDSTASETATGSKSTATKDSSDSQTTDFNTANLNTAAVETGTNTEESDSTETGKSKNSKTTKKNKSSEATHTSYNNLDPAGSVVLQSPVTTVQATPLFKIGDNVNFAWNYTSLQGTPTAIDVLVSCSSKTETWTLTQNMTFATKVSYIWDTSKDGGVDEKPLGVEMYTLIIKDSDSSITEIADSGYLQAYTGLKFGLYTPMPYTPLSDWKCVGCNAASSLFNGQAFGLALTMSFITVASFTWFVTGLGLQ